MAREKRKLRDFGNLWPAEALILAGLDDPHTTMVGDGERPDADAPQDRRVRASFLRWCALGGGKDHRLHETGLRIAGALVVGDGEADPFQGDTATPGLDLEGCEVRGDLAFMNCRFEHPPVLRAARLRNLFLNGSALPGLQADGLATTGGVFLRKAETEGAVRLRGASIGGDLDCDGGTFRNEGGIALNADRLATTGSVFLRNAKTDGEVCLLGASIGRDLSCNGGTFRNKGGDALSADGLTTTGCVFLRKAETEGEIRLIGASIGRDLSCNGGMFMNKGGVSLNANRVIVTGALFWRGGARAEGRLDLTAAQIGAINDVPADWPERGDLLLNRCEYGAFTGFGISGEERIDWLSRQNPARYSQDFWPQPWEQCAKILREMGHAEDARAVLIDKERRQRADRRQRLAIRLEAGRMRARLAREKSEGALEDANERIVELRRKSGRDAAVYCASVARSPHARERDGAEQAAEQIAAFPEHVREDARQFFAEAFPKDLAARDPDLGAPLSGAGTAIAAEAAAARQASALTFFAHLGPRTGLNNRLWTAAISSNLLARPSLVPWRCHLPRGVASRRHEAQQPLHPPLRRMGRLRRARQ